MVSVIIPCYNYAHYLPEAIQSVLGQTYNDIEIIVVNDGSTDNTAEVASRYPVKVINQENKGLAGARNAGIREAEGDYILPLDADDLIRHDFIEKAVKLNGIVSTGMQEFGERNLYHRPQTDMELKDFLEANRINCCAMYQKKAWEDAGGYDEQMRDGYEDWEFWIRLLAIGYKVSTIDEPLFFYRIHSDSMINSTIKKHEQIFNYVRTKHVNLYHENA